MGGPLNLDYYDSLGIDSSKVILDYDPLSAVDTNIFKPISKQEQSELRVNYGISNVDFTIGWVGRISDDKEIWETIELCSHIKKEYPLIRFKLLVIGDGWKRPELEELIFSNNLQEEYIRIEKVSQRELPKFYSLIDFEVLLDEDPMGGSHIREAMACERVVISVNGLSGVQGKLINNGETGFLVDPLNRIENAAQLIINNYSDKDLLKLIGMNARVFVKNNSYEKLAKIILREISI
jgi:glycosyltransferase involved in cell wall biosynthesis